jgi:hypothetical protein
VSAHLSGQRRIQPHDLAAYLRVLDRHERAALLSTWLRDNWDPELIGDLLDGTKTDSMPGPQENQRRMLDWWATAIVHDSGLAKILDGATTQSGFKFPSGLFFPWDHRKTTAKCPSTQLYAGIRVGKTYSGAG